MSDRLRLVIFDVDGTLVDSQATIVSSMAAAFAAVDHPLPDRQTLLSVVGLSLDQIYPILAPELSTTAHRQMVEAYKNTYMTERAEAGTAQTAPFYAGAKETLERLQAVDNILLGVATGKSKRGLDKLIEGHGLEGLFVTQQVADFHPSKPHPSMIRQAIQDAGVSTGDTVMVGDTSFDMEMAAAAGVPGIGVSWGYHGRDRLGAAAHMIDDFAGLPTVLQEVWGLQI
ncbi:Hydrolase [Sulfitobacter noctilucicola]|uniref:Phosphoglycolate phosphatase n=1 Tax=Sulfitobacter noctilucicola TaxID=1342301 RepID=A0A7W6Q4X4_9RHOB|nr:HAD-IA family hydrolase [Sulfitobacter noctilucicola]KIN62229.1 Hydrolase [Sulfitobacter noctilucicola]MBB4173257.1 phosphoglycolate phosphatase [Sulfitobacter noctilucicola]